MQYDGEWACRSGIPGMVAWVCPYDSRVNRPTLVRSGSIMLSRPIVKQTRCRYTILSSTVAEESRSMCMPYATMVRQQRVVC